jgi:signal transduction histidine kinase
MRERVEEVGGQLIVDSQPSVTRVLAILPMGEMGMQTHLATQTPAVNSEEIAIGDSL